MSRGSKAVLIPPDNPPKFNPEAPASELKIKAVFGYGGDIRNSVAYNKEDEIVYFSAGTGVISDKSGNQKYHYGHTNDISAFAIDNGRNYIATGDMASPGKPPVIRIWNPSTGKLILNINSASGHLLDKEIIGISFSDDGNRLVAIGNDNNHEITVLETTNNWESYENVLNRQTTTNKVNFVDFSTDNNIIYFGGDKCLYRFIVDSNEYKKVLFGSYNIDVLLCGLNYNNYFLIGTQSGSIYVVEENKIVKSLEGHTSSVNTIALYKDNCIISGGNDQNIIIWSSDFDIINTINIKSNLDKVTNIKNSLVSSINALSYNVNNNSIICGTKRCNIIEFTMNDNDIESGLIIAEGHAHSEVWGCSADPLNNNQVVSSGDDKDLIIWDITTKLPVEIIHLPNLSRSVDFHPTEPLLAVGLGGRDGKSTNPAADDGGFMVINTQTLTTHYEKLKMSKEWISVVKWSPNGKYLCVGSHDNNIYIYDSNNKYKLLFKFTRGTSFVLQCDWSDDNKLIRICYGDYQLLYCDVTNGEQFLNATDISLKKWATHNCIIGWGVQGIWADTSDRTDINACCTNHNGNLLVAVDDNNTVRLYRYPCTKQTAQYKKYYGHSSHIPYCEFTFDDKGLVTCGGNDHTVIYWEVV